MRSCTVGNTTNSVIVSANTYIRFEWTLRNEDPRLYNVFLNIVNKQVRQDIPPANATSASMALTPTTSNSASSSTITGTASSSLALSTSSDSGVATILYSERLSQRTILAINQSLPIHPANAGYFDTLVVPEGRYYLTGRITDPANTFGTSEVFSVIEGNDTSCLAAYASMSESVLASSSTAVSSARASMSTGSTSNATSAASGANAGAGSSKNGSSGLSGGAIAGIVIGVIALLAILGTVVFICFRRRRSERRNAMEGPEMSRSGFTPRFFSTGRVSGSGHAQMPSGGTGLDSGAQSPSALVPLQEAKEEVGENGMTNTRQLGQQTASTSRSAGQDPFATAPNTPGVQDPYEATDFGPGVPGAMVPPVVPTSSRDRRDTPSVTGRPAPLSSTLGRSSSKKRKPVPSLGPELQSEMLRKNSESEDRRASYQITPDPPVKLD